MENDDLAEFPLRQISALLHKIDESRAALETTRRKLVDIRTKLTGVSQPRAAE